MFIFHSFTGTFNDHSGSSYCQQCHAGYYCPLGSINSTQFLCPLGHYCPGGTQYGSQFKCKAGTFSDIPGLSADWQCKKCPPGFYCSTSGLIKPDDECDGGYFCEIGSSSRQPRNLSEGGGICPMRYYCPKGISTPVPCSLGHYCGREGLEFPEGVCDAGWICTGKSLTNQPSGTK